MRHLAAIVLLLSLGCADGKSPVEPTPSPPVPAQVTFTLQGDVRDTASRPLKGASVTVVDGPRASTTAMTDDAGRFSMPGTFTQSAITLVASKEGYSPQTWNVPTSRGPVRDGNWGFSFRLEPLAPSVNLAGEYTLTLTADRACTRLPEEARTRTYMASLAAAPWRAITFVGTLSGARIVSVPMWPPFFQIGVADDFADVSLSFVEQLSDGTYLAIEGGTSASVGPSGITAPFNAHFVRCRNQPAMSPGEYWWCGADVQGDECQSISNQLTLVRR
jgi:carboxypeptidase family protein